MCEENIINEKQPIKWFRRDSVFAVITFIASIIFVSFSLFGGFAIGFTISFFGLFILTVVYMFKSKIKLRVFPVFCGITSLLLSVVFALFRDSLINLLLFFAVFGLYGLFTSLSYKEPTNQSIILNALETLITYPLSFIAKPFSTYASYRTENNKKGPNKQIILGIVISVPLLIVIVPLLISSDLAFEGLMYSLFSGVGTLIAKIILGFILSIFLFSMLFALKNELKREVYYIPQKNQVKGLPSVTSITVLSIISAFYTVYLFSQSAYFFSAFSGILPKGYTFSPSDYARRGFFELCAVSGINLTIIAVLTLATEKRENGKLHKALTALATAICIFSVIFTATAISKMLLYIDTLGLTRLRLLTGLFMTLLALIFIGIIINLYTKKFPLTKYIITVLSVFALTIGFCDVDRTIAHYNISRYNSGSLEEIDVTHLCTLSNSAVPYLAELLDDSNENIRSEVASELYKRADKFYRIDIKNNKAYLTDNDKTGFKGFNYTQDNAKIILKENIAKIINEKPNNAEDYEQWF